MQRESVPALIQRWLFTPHHHPLLRLAAAAYTSVANARQTRPSHDRPPYPVISVGSLLMGGAGKTPIALWLARQLVDTSHRPGLILRGYRGTFAAPRRIELSDPAQLIGDEALMAKRALPFCSIAIARDRLEGLRLLAQSIDCAILDDGFQHRRLPRDLDIVVVPPEIDALLPLPAGPLREDRAALERADLIWLHNPHSAQQVTERVAGRAVDVFSHYALRDIVPLRAAGAHPPFSLVTGIARNQAVRSVLAEHGITVDTHLCLRDHSMPKKADVERLVRSTHGVLITEKDAARFAHTWPDALARRTSVIRVNLCVTHGQETLLRRVKGLFS